MGQPTMPEGMSPAVCEQLANMPNPPISVAACKSMMGLAAGLDAGAGDPSVYRPGDDALTCPQIFGELQSMAGVGITDATAAQAESVVKDGTALAARQAGALTAFMVESFALGAAMGAASAVMPNFALAAIAAAWQAQFVALGMKAQAEQAPINARMTEVMQGASGDLMRSMQDNPRFARLGQLAMAKNCEPPAMPAR